MDKGGTAVGLTGLPAGRVQSTGTARGGLRGGEPERGSLRHGTGAAPWDRRSGAPATGVTGAHTVRRACDDRGAYSPDAARAMSAANVETSLYTPG